MAQPILGIEEFPSDDQFWRIALFGGVNRNSSVPSEPVIEVLLASLPAPNVDPYGRAAQESFATHIARVGVGQLPYLSIGSVWHRKRPIVPEVPRFRRIEMDIDVSDVRFVSIGDLVDRYHVIDKSRYNFGKHWPIAATTQMAAIEIEGDPWAILIPVIELIRFYYAPSTRIAQALFWGEYAKSINPEKCGQLEDGPYRVHLRKWIRDADAWTLARFHASDYMQRQVRTLYQGLQKHFVDSSSTFPQPFREFRCGFPFSGRTILEGIHVDLPGPEVGVGRLLALKLIRCSAPFPFDQLLCDRDNRNLKGENSGEDDLEPGWRRKIEEEDKNLDESGNPSDGNIHSDGEPKRDTTPLVIDIREDRFAFLDGKKLQKGEPERQKYRSAPVVGGKGRPLIGFGTGSGTWGKADRKRAEINTSRPGNVDKPTLPASLETFFAAMRKLSSEELFVVSYVSAVDDELDLTHQETAVGFPDYDPVKRKRIKWATISLANDERRSRQVVVAEVSTPVGVCYVLEAERIHKNDKLSILVLAAMDRTRLTSSELNSILLESACRGRWWSKDEMPQFRRATTTHQKIASTEVLAGRIKKKVCEVLDIPIAKKAAGKSDPPKAAADVGAVNSSVREVA